MNASEVLNRLTSHKRSQGELVRFVAGQNVDLASRIYDCGSWLRIREWIENGETRLKNANFCKQFLLCRSCAARRAGKLVESYSKKVDYISECRPNLIPAMITLTVKNGGDLSERIAHLKQSWQRMISAARKAKNSPKKNLPIEWNKVQGCIRSIEITKKTAGWHPHAHVFVLLSDYVSHSWLSQEWERFTGDSFIVDVRACKNGIVPGLIECLKYASKITELEPCDAYEVSVVAKGSRFTDALGIMRGVLEPDIDFDDGDFDGPYRDYFARWLSESQSYKITPADTPLVIERPNKPNTKH
jgi:hypothetical protein